MAGKEEHMMSGMKRRAVHALAALTFAVLCVLAVVFPCRAASRPVRYLMVGDSYSDHGSCGSGPLWQQYVSGGLGLSNTVYAQKGGCGFAKTTGQGAYQFLTILKKAAAQTDCRSITHILVGGGIGNDYTYKSGGATEQEIRSAMRTFDDYANSVFPNLTCIEYAGINWGISETRKDYCRKRCYIYYDEAKRLGWQPLYGSESGLRKTEYETFFYYKNDRIHPRDPGERLIANAIMRSMVKYAGRTGVRKASYLTVPKPAIYSVSYQLGGGKVSGNPASYRQGFVKAWTLKNPARTGYTFVGWTGTGLSGAVKTVTVKPGRTGNLAYKAAWKKNPAPVLPEPKTVLRAYMKRTTSNSVTLSWNRVSGAYAYVIYGSDCQHTMKKLAKVGSGVTSWTCRKLKRGTYYKFRVYAVNRRIEQMYHSEKLFITTNGGRYTNYYGVMLNTKRVTMKKGRTFRVKASGKPVGGGRVKVHAGIVYLTDNPKVAKVGSGGVITAKGKGSCYIYAISQSGCWNRVRVTVS